MAQPITFTRPRRHVEVETLAALARQLQCARAPLQRLRDQGLIEEPWHTKAVCRVLDAYNTEARQAGNGNPVDVNAVRERLGLEVAVAPGRASVGGRGQDRPAQALSAVAGREAEPGATGAALDADGAAARAGGYRLNLDMLGIPDLPGEMALERKQRLDGDWVALRIAIQRGDLLLREDVQSDLHEVAATVQRELGDLFRRIDAQYVLIDTPEARVAWGQEQLRLALERVVGQMEALYAERG